MVSIRPCGDFKNSYEQDEAIFQTRFMKIMVGLFIVFLLILPQFLSPYLLYLANTVSIAIIGALGMNIVTGFTGLISLGQGALIGVGAYTVAILSSKLGFPVWAALPLAGFMAALAGMIIGTPSLRLKGFYLAMATMAGHYIIWFVLWNWVDLTGGPGGIAVRKPVLFGLDLNRDDLHFYYLALPMAILAIFACKNLFRTRVGRAFIAIRDRDLSAEVIGVNLFKYKLLSFFISSFYAGITGGLFAYYMKLINPEAFQLFLAIDYLAMIIVGGMGSILGSIYGAIFIVLVPEILQRIIEYASRFMPLQNIFAPLREIIFGLMIVLFLIFKPEGIAKMWEDAKAYFKLWPYAY